MSEQLSNDIATWVIQHEGMPKRALATGIKALIDRATPTPDVAELLTDVAAHLETGLDESQLARDVMLLMNLSETCSGLNPDTDIPESAKHLTWQCRECGYHGVYLTPHPRVPKPLREVRDELLGWLGTQGFTWTIHGTPVGCSVTLASSLQIGFAKITDEATALALGAVRLMGKS